MKLILKYIKLSLFIIALLGATACQKRLDELAENKSFTSQTDYTISTNMDLPLKGLYSVMYNFSWENFPLISVRGDDVFIFELKKVVIFYRDPFILKLLLNGILLLPLLRKIRIANSCRVIWIPFPFKSAVE